MVAATFGHAVVADVLIQQGANLFLKDSVRGRSLRLHVLLLPIHLDTHHSLPWRVFVLWLHSEIGRRWIWLWRTTITRLCHPCKW